jgi:hypothetical protein
VARLYKCCLVIFATAPCVEGQIRNKFTRLQREPNFVILREEAKMHRTRYLRLVMLVIVLGTAVLLGQAPEKAATSGEPTRTEDFATAMKKLRDRWVQEFNAGHADKVADLYAPEAVLMRRNGSVHNRDSGDPVTVTGGTGSDQSSGGQRDKDKEIALALLDTARYELERAMALGYSAQEPEYKTMKDEISNIQKQLKKNEDTSSFFSKLQDRLSAFMARLSKGKLSRHDKSQPKQSQPEKRAA